jgi:hypothetical protein
MRTALLAVLTTTSAIAAIALPSSLIGRATGNAPPIQAVAKISNAAAVPARSPAPVIVELFTSEGCSDCPPADRLLYALEQKQPVAGAEIIPLEQHVDYWDSEGWRDPFSSAQFTLRQRDYVYTFNLQSAYTPQMVIDGTAQFVGSDSKRALAAIAKAALVPKENLKIERFSSDTRPDGRNMRLRVSLAPLGAANPKHGADVLLAVTEDNLASNVTRGENAGTYMNHLAVVRELRVLGRVDSVGGFSAAPDVTFAENWKRGNLHVVAFVQDRSTKRVLGASTLSLSEATK